MGDAEEERWWSRLATLSCLSSALTLSMRSMLVAIRIPRCPAVAGFVVIVSLAATVAFVVGVLLTIVVAAVVVVLIVLSMTTPSTILIITVIVLLILFLPASPTALCCKLALFIFHAPHALRGRGGGSRIPLSTCVAAA